MNEETREWTSLVFQLLQLFVLSDLQLSSMRCDQEGSAGELSQNPHL